MRFYLVQISASGYSLRDAFYAGTLQEAARRHVAAYAAIRTGSLIVMRSQDGRRYSVADSTIAARCE